MAWTKLCRGVGAGAPGARWEEGWGKKICILFSALISVPQPRGFQRKNGVGGDAWEGRGEEETSLGENSARRRIAVLVERRKRGFGSEIMCSPTSEFGHKTMRSLHFLG